MMDIFFQDPTEIPLPPQEVRIRELAAEAWPDGRRVRVYLEVDPFQKRPSADLTITAQDGLEVAHASLIESMTRKIELTLHLRSAPAPGEFTLTAVLFFTQPLPEPVEPSPDTPTESEIPTLPEPLVVDQRSIQFTVDAP